MFSLSGITSSRNVLVLMLWFSKVIHAEWPNLYISKQNGSSFLQMIILAKVVLVVTKWACLALPTGKRLKLHPQISQHPASTYWQTGSLFWEGSEWRQWIEGREKNKPQCETHISNLVWSTLRHNRWLKSQLLFIYCNAKIVQNRANSCWHVQLLESM